MNHLNNSKNFRCIKNCVAVHEINLIIASLFAQFKFKRFAFSMKIIFQILFFSFRWIEIYRYFIDQSTIIDERISIICTFSLPAIHLQRARNVIVIIKLQHQIYYDYYCRKFDCYSFIDVWFDFVFWEATSLERSLCKKKMSYEYLLIIKKRNIFYVVWCSKIRVKWQNVFNENWKLKTNFFEI